MFYQSIVQFFPILIFLNGKVYAEYSKYLTEEVPAYARRILKAIGRYIIELLKGIGIEVPMPHGAFYIFPDFGMYSGKMEARGIHTSVEMCHAIFEETGVGILPGFDFGREPTEMTVRIAFIDFDGESALQTAAGEYLDREIDRAFIQTHAPRLIEAINRLASWFSGL